VEPLLNRVARDRIIAESDARPETVLVIGDSIAEEWPRELRDEVFGAPSYNFGEPGDKLGNIVWRLQRAHYFPGNRFKTIVVIAGTNNVSRNRACEISGGLIELTDMLREMSPEASIYVVSILPRGSGLKIAIKKIGEINRDLKASGNLRFVDAHSAILAACQGQEHACSLYSDRRLHLSAEGYRLLGTMLRAAFR
jgi:hypothetical protein